MSRVHPKVAASAITATLVTLVLALLKYAHVPQLTVLESSAIVSVLSAAAGWLKSGYPATLPVAGMTNPTGRIVVKQSETLP